MLYSHKFIFSIAILLLFIYPGVSEASIVIRLKNGREFITYHYWTAGNQTMFYLEGGIVGVEANFISEIKKVSLKNRRVIQSTSEEAGGKEMKNSSTPTPQESPTENTPGEMSAEEKPKGDFTIYQKKHLELRTALEKALERYRMASGQQDKEAEEKAREEFRALSKQLFDLSDEVKAKNNGVLPPWWEKL